MTHRILFFAIIVLMFSCVDPEKDTNSTKDSKLIQYVDCVYIPNHPDLKDLDSLASIFKFKKIDSLYRIKDLFQKEDQMFLSILKSKAYFKGRNYRGHLSLINEMDSLFRIKADYHELLFPAFLVEKAKKFMVNRLIDSTTVYITKAIDLYNEYKYESCAQKVSSLSVLSVAQAYYGGEIGAAIIYLKEIEGLLDNSTGAEKSRFRNYYSLASVNRRLKKEALALNYANLAIAELLKSESIDTSNLAISYSLRANVYYGFNKMNEAILDFKRAARLGELGRLKVSYMNIFYSGIINGYTAFRDPHNALIYINKLKKILIDDKNTMGLYYKNKGNIVLIEKVNFKYSIELFKIAINNFESARVLDKHQLIETYHLLSRALTYSRRYKEAHEVSKLVLLKLLDNEKFCFESFSKDPISILYLTNHFALTKKIFQETQLKRYKIEQDELTILINRVIRFYDNEIDEDVILNNQIKLSKYYYHYFEYCNNSIEFGLDKLLNIIAQYKSKSLQKNSVLNSSVWIDKYPILFERHQNNRSTIEEVKYKLHNEKGNLDSLNKLYHELLIEEAEIIDSFALINFHGQENFKVDDNLLVKINEYCIKENAIVVDFFIPDYCVTDSIIVNNIGYAFVSNGRKSEILSFPNIVELIEEVESFKLNITNNKNLNLVSKSLYKKLLFFLDDYLIGDNQSLIIIPDNTLRRLAFEILKSEDNSYLIEKFDVSYGFSMGSIIKKERGIKRNEKNKVLLFSHSNKETILNQINPILAELPGSYNEYKLINKIFSSSCKSFAGLESTKNNFFKYATEYPIIHLALHGKADLSSRHNSRIFFRSKDSIESLYPFELINKKIHPQLLVLSACESGYGRLYNQEGMYSIARAFYLSGANNIISSLWELDDDASFEILKFFYEEVESEHFSNYRKALQNAKIKYLLQHQGLQQVSAKLWAGLIIYQ